MAARLLIGGVHRFDFRMDSANCTSSRRHGVARSLSTQPFASSRDEGLSMNGAPFSSNQTSLFRLGGLGAFQTALRLISEPLMCTTFENSGQW